MAAVTQRVWRSGRRKVKRVAWGFTYQGPDGRQMRSFREDWSKEDAEQALAAIRFGQGTAPATTTTPGITLGALLTTYLATKAAKGKKSLQDDRERGQRLLDGLGASTPLAAITTVKVAEYQTRRLTSDSRLNRRYAPSTINRELALLKSMLRLAQKWDYLDRVPGFDMATEHHTLRFLSEEEITRLLDACRRSRSPHLAAIVTVALQTGMRREEILGLTWQRVNFGRSVLVLEKTKSSKGRELPINRRVYDVLAPLRAEAKARLPQGGDPRGSVWRTADGTVAASVRTAYENALDEAGITGATFHTLRHTFASWYIIRGGHLAKLQVLLGHSTIGMTMKYAHLAPDHLQGSTALLEDLGEPVAASPALVAL